MPQINTEMTEERAELARAFGEVLRAQRQAMGLSSETLALRAGLDRTYPWLLERGGRAPSMLVVFCLARVLKISPAKLVEYTHRQMAHNRGQGRRG
jgi:transcriptional regulator with XRE-family HTH domain